MHNMRDLSNLEQGGFVHIYAGDGKGKTTAAVGLAVRAVGWGRSVLFCQFLKGMETGELQPLRRLGVDVMRAECPKKFFFQMSGPEKEKAASAHKRCLEGVREKITGGGVDLLVLDEVLDAVNMGLITEESLVCLIKSGPGHMEIVLTGRNPGETLFALAGYRTDFVCVCHPYQSGVGARKGIEF